MVAVPEAIDVLYPSAIPLVDWKATNDGVVTVITFWNPLVGPQPTQSQIAAVTPAQVDAVKRARLNALAKQVHVDNEAQNLALRATVKILVDEVNILRQWLSAFQAQTALATNLATLQRRLVIELLR